MNQKTTLALTLITLAVMGFMFSQTQNERIPSQYQAWKQKYDIKFTSQFEEIYRQRVFLENFAKMNAHNAKKDKSYQMGLNQFSAYTTQEFIQLYLNPMMPTKNIVSSSNDETVGADIDWTAQGAVTPVKNQGSCSACWAFAAAGAVEGLSKVAYGTLQEFSEQQLVDCSGPYGNLGCNGGLIDYSYKFIKQKGIATEKSYPYVGHKQTCQLATGQFKISNLKDINNCNNLATALDTQPVAVAVDATHFASYKSGVFENCTTKLNFDVLLVGANAESWKVKNSWGTSWGENGYMRIKRGNTCGICNSASIPVK